MCGACGMRQFVKPKVRSDQRYLGYRYMYLKDLDPLLKFSIQQKQDFDTWSELTKALSSVYASVHIESNGLFSIHPETVDVVEINGARVEKVYICGGCWFAIKIKKKIPKYALAQEGGIYDCGSISRISNQLVLPLTMVEKQLCAAQRLYGNIVKLKPHPQNPRSLEGNIIVFRHDGPESASSITSLPCMDVLHSVKVLFFGTNDQFETARRNAVVSLFPVFV